MELRVLQRRGGFDVTCQGTVPAAAVAFLQSTDFEDAVRNAVSFGGDADTLACIAGAMAEAHYGGVPTEIQAEVPVAWTMPCVLKSWPLPEYGVPLCSSEVAPQTDED